MSLPRLRELIDERNRHSVVLTFRPDAAPADHVCATIAAELDRPVTAIRLRSDHLSEGEAAQLKNALAGDGVLLLDVGDASSLPLGFAAAWEAFTENPRHTSATAGRWTSFGPEDAEGFGGTLVLVLPRGYGSSGVESLPRVFLEEDDLSDVEAPAIKVEALGRPFVEVSMQLLYELHHRDPPNTASRSSIADVLQGDGPVTWQELKTLLQQQPDRSMLEILESFERQGRLSSEQVDLAAEAIAYLNRERDGLERIGASTLAPSIYHLLWHSEPRLREGYVFRGQASSRWRQDTTLLRDAGTGEPPDFATIQSRLHRTIAFVEALQTKEMDIVGRELTDDERLAIAQHYGLPTPLLDYSHDLGVAAFFATGSGDGDKLQEGDIGIIYYVEPDDLLTDEPPEPSSRRVDFREAAGVRGGRLRVIEPDLPDAENRIARQQGVFIDGFDAGDFQRLSTGTLYFRQIPGLAFEDAVRGITREHLLTPDAELQRLADAIAEEERELPAWVKEVRFPGDDVFGSVGIDITVNLAKGQRFLDKLALEAEALDPELRAGLYEILQRHFSEARTTARTAEVGITEDLKLSPGYGGTRSALDEVDATLAALAELAGLDTAELTSRLRRHRPHGLISSQGFLFNEPIDPVGSDLLSSLVLAAGLFVVGFEYMRTVPGDFATQYIQQADSALRRG